MTSGISEFIIKTLCDNQGCLDFSQLNEKITQRFTDAAPILQTVLFDKGRIAIQEGSQKVADSQIISPDSLIVAKTSLRLCQKKHGECAQCEGLHLCKHYVCGECAYGPKCKKPHSLDSTQNADLLKKCGLHNLIENQLFQLLLQNDPYLLPEICPYYNKGNKDNGPHGSCTFSTSCIKLHICQHYLQGDCKFGASCKRAHDVDEQGKKLLRGFSQENMKNLHVIYRNKFIIIDQQEGRASATPEVRTPSQQPPHSNPGPPSAASPSKPISDADRNEICLFFIRRHCSYKEKCARVHWHLPYRWQVLESDGVTWKDLPNMEEIEKAYCDPQYQTSCVDQPSLLSSIHASASIVAPAAAQFVDFVSMTYGRWKVRRLSTASSVLKPPHFILTTEWVWYWKDDSEKWLEYGQDDTSASVTSQTLENVYLADRDAEIPFGTGKHQSILHFKGALGAEQMYQQNVKYQTKREVRRRPRFVSAQDVEVKLKSTSSHSSRSATADSFPSHWDKNALPDTGYKLVPLSKSAEEYNKTEMLFKCTLPRSTINTIERIQNPSLWEIFQWQKEQMKKRNGGKDVTELSLFHGTDQSLIDAICEQNFDWRICGVHGTAYGKGSYFAKDASYSDRYAKGTPTKTMFVALVLVGEYTDGRSNYVRPPPKDGGKTLYDSCVNSKNNPSIYVVFEKPQIYPAYLINYS